MVRLLLKTNFIYDILKTKGQGLGLSVKTLRRILYSLGYCDVSHMEVTARLWELKREGRVVRNKRLWRVVTYGG
jgi:hypothetical protein